MGHKESDKTEVTKHARTIKISPQCSQRWLNSPLQEGPPHILGNCLVHVTVHTPSNCIQKGQVPPLATPLSVTSPADHLASLNVSITACLRRGCRGQDQRQRELTQSPWPWVHSLLVMFTFGLCWSGFLKHNV